RAAVPEGAEFVSADPAPTRRTGRDLAWDLGPLPGGGKRDVTLVLRPTRRGPLALPVTAEAEGGLRADKTATATVDTAGLKVAAGAVTRSELKVALTGPDVVAVGEEGLFEVRVTNAGDAAVTGVTVRLSLPPGLTAKAGGDDPGTAGVSPARRSPAGDVPPQS